MDGNANNALDWTDGDGDGAWDAGEGERWTVTANDGVNDGAYWFVGLAAGTYTVREAPQAAQANWKQTYPVAPSFEHVVMIDPAAGVRANGVFRQAASPNFGNVLPDISGYKWNDQDGDGVWEAP